MIDARVKHFEARVLISLLLSYPKTKSFKEIYHDILYPIYSIIGGIKPRTIVIAAMKELRKRKVILSQQGTNAIPEDKVDEAIDYVEYRIKNQ